jgi:hypothetical protein
MRPILFRDEIKVKKVLLYHLYIALLALLPFFIAMLAGFIGKCLSCNINEAGTDQCIRAGIAFGNVLNPLVVIGWLLVLTLPLGVIATVVLIIIAIHDTIYHTRR